MEYPEAEMLQKKLIPSTKVHYLPCVYIYLIWLIEN